MTSGTKKAIKNNERIENGKGNPRDFHGSGPHWTGRPLIVRGSPRWIEKCGSQPANTRMIDRRSILGALAFQSLEGGRMGP